MAQSYKNLFRIPTITENIALFRSLMDSHEIKPGEALALSGSIHAELRRGKGQDGSAYARYAQTMALLNHHMPDVHQHVIANWQLPKSGTAVSTKTSTKQYSDSLFDDTIAMRVPVTRQAFEANSDQVADGGEMFEVSGDEGENGEANEGGEQEEEDEESDEEEEPAEADESENEEWEMGENEIEEGGTEEETEFEEEVEEPETEELVYEDISENESYDEFGVGMEVNEDAEYMDETEYEKESMEEEDPPWTDD